MTTGRGVPVVKCNVYFKTERAEMFRLEKFKNFKTGLHCSIKKNLKLNQANLQK